ncbi:MAG: cyclopropane-fatty-acyl-phospholipid synthase family protein [Rhodospirillaceae bacterium]|nr:cyclopropane-fatty-acyl-phospholipid synthase family protein [Rhodospirillaceae bacterium]
MTPFDLIFRNLIRTGTLTVTDARGARHVYTGSRPGGHVAMTLHDPKLHGQIFLDPEMAIGEGYMNGTLTLDGGITLYDFLDVIYGNYINAPRSGLFGALLELQRMARRAGNRNPIQRARRNVAHHYDLKDELFDLFLDGDKQYSCAYFKSPTDSLEQAQAAKKRHIAAKLFTRPGQTALDIGSGWGGLGLTLAKDFGLDVTGITLSDHQLALSRKRATEAGLEERCRFELKDYRLEENLYDRIVSVGMFEHVGRKHFATFFRHVARLLKDDGVAVIHTIVKFRDPGPIPSWTSKYVFPGAYVPTLSELTPAIEKSGLFMADVEILRLHYAETLRHWRERLYANRAKVEAMYDARFFRMWDFYLTGSEIAFRQGELAIAQVQLEKRLGTVPLTRDYLAANAPAAAIAA